jgi:hypothetical protein
MLLVLNAGSTVENISSGRRKFRISEAIALQVSGVRNPKNR